MTRRPRKPSPAEVELWRAATRDTTPLPGRAAPPKPAPPDPEPPSTEQRPPPSQKKTRPSPMAALPPAITPRRPPPELAHGRGASLDRRQAERLRRGRLPIEGRLDLHGMTQAEAHGRLAAFVAASAAQGKRCVLVITGKGGLGREGAGVLRAAVPRWLNAPPLREHVLIFDYAQPQHGGLGALYVLLKRRRE